MKPEDIKKIHSLFKDDEKEQIEKVEYQYFYAIRATLFNSKIENWKDAEEKEFLDNIKQRLNEAIDWFNDGRKIQERKIELVSLDMSGKSLVLLLSCVDRQKNDMAVKKFGAFSRYLYTNQSFKNLVTNTSKQNRLFTTQIIEVDKNFNPI